MKIEYCFCIVVLFLFNVQNIVFSEESTDIEEIATRSIQHQLMLRSIKFEGVTEDRYQDSENKEKRNSSINNFTYNLAGDKYRWDVDFLLKKNNGSIRKDNFIVSFDGLRYQNYSKMLGILAMERNYFDPDVLRMNDPLALPYIFLFVGDKPLLYTKVRNKLNWSDFIKNSKILGVEKYQNEEVVVVAYTTIYRDTTIKLRILFLKNYGYYPVLVQREVHGDLKNMVTVKHFKTISIDGLSVIIPLEIIYDIGGYHEDVAIQQNSIQVNPQISSDFFTLSSTDIPDDKTVIERKTQ